MYVYYSYIRTIYQDLATQTTKPFQQQLNKQAKLARKQPTDLTFLAEPNSSSYLARLWQMMNFETHVTFRKSRSRSRSQTCLYQIKSLLSVCLSVSGVSYCSNCTSYFRNVELNNHRCLRRFSFAGSSTFLRASL